MSFALPWKNCEIIYSCESMIVLGQSEWDQAIMDECENTKHTIMKLYYPFHTYITMILLQGLVDFNMTIFLAWLFECIYIYYCNILAVK